MLKPTMKPYFLQTDVTRACEEQTILTGKDYLIPYIRAALDLSRQCFAEVVYNKG